jgi:hypothetical protein
MSYRNGDRSRAHRERKQKLMMRTRLREYRLAIAAGTGPAAESAPPAAKGESAGSKKK